jgi:mediator of RNA polymerase II transcription subunit 23
MEVISYCLLPVYSFHLCHTIAETQCWQDWLLFADIFFFLMKSGCIDFLDFVDKLASRVTNGDQQILRSNHVTWLLAQIIRIEIVMNTLSSDPRKVICSCMMICIHLFFFSTLLNAIV